MTVYQQRFAAYGQRISQVLLTHDVLDYHRVDHMFIIQWSNYYTGESFR